MKIKITPKVRPVFWHIDDETKEVCQVYLTKKYNSGYKDDPGFNAHKVNGDKSDYMYLLQSELFETKDQANKALYEKLDYFIKRLKDDVKSLHNYKKEKLEELKEDIKENNKDIKRMEEKIKNYRKKLKELDKSKISP